MELLKQANGIARNQELSKQLMLLHTPKIPLTYLEKSETTNCKNFFAHSVQARLFLNCSQLSLLFLISCLLKIANIALKTNSEKLQFIVDIVTSY